MQESKSAANTTIHYAAKESTKNLCRRAGRKWYRISLPPINIPKNASHGLWLPSAWPFVLLPTGKSKAQTQGNWPMQCLPMPTLGAHQVSDIVPSLKWGLYVVVYLSTRLLINLIPNQRRAMNRGSIHLHSIDTTGERLHREGERAVGSMPTLGGNKHTCHRINPHSHLLSQQRSS